MIMSSCLQHSTAFHHKKKIAGKKKQVSQKTIRSAEISSVHVIAFILSRTPQSCSWCVKNENKIKVGSWYWTHNENNWSSPCTILHSWDGVAYKLRIIHMCRETKSKIVWKERGRERWRWGGEGCSPKPPIYSPSLDYNSQWCFLNEPISCRAQIKQLNTRVVWGHDGRPRDCRTMKGCEDVSCAIRRGSSSDWPGPAASSRGAAHACSEGCGRPAAGSVRSSVVPGTALQTCGLWWLDLHGPGSLQHLQDSYRKMREWGHVILNIIADIFPRTLKA